jgi:hypothetical protein
MRNRADLHGSGGIDGGLSPAEIRVLYGCGSAAVLAADMYWIRSRHAGRG